MPPDDSAAPQDWRRDDYTVTTRRERMDVDAIHAYLVRSYWASGIARETVEEAMRHSLCFGLYAGDRQIGFARVITDRATFAYLCDVFIDDSYRGRGLGKWLMAAVMDHPDLQGLRRWTLATRDAHGLYKQFGWTDLKHPSDGWRSTSRRPSRNVQCSCGTDSASRWRPHGAPHGPRTARTRMVWLIAISSALPSKKCTPAAIGGSTASAVVSDQ